ncbi:MAG: hypothetical protein Kow0065_23760 [Methylomicrobium sp.]
MSLAETIYQHSLNLPEPAAQEVLDFIEFLKQRYSKNLVYTALDERLSSLTPEQRAAYAYLQTVRIDWGGKPSADREDANARR